MAVQANRRRLFRSQTVVPVGVTSTKLVGPNTKRIGLIVSTPAAPSEQSNSFNVYVAAKDMFTAGDMVSYTVPAGKYSILSFFCRTIESGGGNFVSLYYRPAAGGVLSLLPVGVSNYCSTGFSMNLIAGDTVALHSFGGNAETSDIVLAGTEYPTDGRVTLAFTGPAILDQGINLHPGTPPLFITGEHIGQAITEDVYAVALAPVTISVIDLSEDCECPSMVMGRR